MTPPITCIPSCCQTCVVCTDDFNRASGANPNTGAPSCVVYYAYPGSNVLPFAGITISNNSLKLVGPNKGVMTNTRAVNKITARAISTYPGDIAYVRLIGSSYPDGLKVTFGSLLSNPIVRGLMEFTDGFDNAWALTTSYGDGSGAKMMMCIDYDREDGRVALVGLVGSTQQISYELLNLETTIAQGQKFQYAVDTGAVGNTLYFEDLKAEKVHSVPDPLCPPCTSRICTICDTTFKGLGLTAAGNLDCKTVYSGVWINAPAGGGIRLNSNGGGIIIDKHTVDYLPWKYFEMALNLTWDAFGDGSSTLGDMNVWMDQTAYLSVHYDLYQKNDCATIWIDNVPVIKFRPQRDPLIEWRLWLQPDMFVVEQRGGGGVYSYRTHFYSQRFNKNVTINFSNNERPSNIIEVKRLKLRETAHGGFPTTAIPDMPWCNSYVEFCGYFNMGQTIQP